LQIRNQEEIELKQFDEDMKILKEDSKQGIIRVHIDQGDDLWALHQVIEPGDLCKANTQRKITGSGESERTRAVERKWMVLTIEAEKNEFNGSSVRITGPIVDGPEDIAR